ncbi:MAG: type II secretion system protein [Phycisphaerales bacterium JB037]
MNRVRASNSVRAFTLVELLAVIVILGVLAALAIVGVSRVLGSARDAADRNALAGLKISIGQFENEFSFLPPLVVDGEPLDRSNQGPVLDDYPVTGRKGVAVRDRDFLEARAANGAIDSAIIAEQGNGAWSDRRYSKVSLPYYLSGALGAAHPDDGTPVDGVQGAGFRTPRRDGLFEPRGTTHPAFYEPRDADQFARSHVDPLEFREHGVTLSGALSQGDPNVIGIVDRNGRAYRYYRWVNSEPADPGDPLGSFLNIPRILQSPATWSDVDASAADDSADYNGARYALVAAGPDGMFGTESEADLQQAFNSSASLEALRARAVRDNIVEVGK